jgi:hypothetical protein
MLVQVSKINRHGFDLTTVKNYVVKLEIETIKKKRWFIDEKDVWILEEALEDRRREADTDRQEERKSFKEKKKEKRKCKRCGRSYMAILDKKGLPYNSRCDKCHEKEHRSTDHRLSGGTSVKYYNYMDY